MKHLGTFLFLSFFATSAHARSYDAVAFQQAVENGNVKEASKQIAHGASVNDEFPGDPSGGSLHETPLITAIINGRAAMVKFLVARGADVNHGSRVGTPLTYAAACTKTGEMRRLPKDAAACVEIVEKLLASGARMDEKTVDGQTPFDVAQSAGNTKLAEMLKPTENR